MNRARLVGVSAALVGSVLAASATSALAGSGSIGLGVAMTPDYEGSENYKPFPAPFGHYNFDSGRSIKLENTGGLEKAARVKADIISDDWSEIWEAGPVLQYRLKRDDVDNNKVDHMDSVDAAVEAGAFVGFKSGRWDANLTFAGDVSSEYDGYLVYLKGNYTWPVNDSFALVFGAHATWADSNYMDTYFGVSSKDSRQSGLPRYEADSGIKDVGLKLSGRYSLTQSWGILAVVGYTRLLNDAEDSPLVKDVGDENQYNGVVAVTYSF